MKTLLHNTEVAFGVLLLIILYPIITVVQMIESLIDAEKFNLINTSKEYFSDVKYIVKTDFRRW